MVGGREKLRNPGAEAARFRVRALVGFTLVALSLAVLAGWYFRLQVIQHSEFARQSEANRIKPRPVIPGRGLIYDRQGRILADNVPAYRLDVTPEDAGDTDELIAGLSRIFQLDPDDVERFGAERRARRGFQPIALKLRVSEAEAAR